MSDALYHLHASIGSRASGASAGTRYEYLMREGIFAEPGRCAEDFVESISDNMPEWAQADPGLYWRMADLQERDKAVLFREVEFAIPHGIPEAERGQWAEKMAQAVATTKDGAHPFTLAVHAGKDGANWNAHVIVSERVNDGISRDPEKWFSRAAVASRKTGELDPAKGGARKTREMQPSTWLNRQRKTWERIGNEALAKAGREERLDCRSYKDRGIKKKPQIHLGRKAHQMMLRGANSDRVATYREIEEANRLIELERSSAADLQQTTERIFTAAADRKAAAAEIARVTEIEKQQQQARLAAFAKEYPEVLRMRPEDAERWFTLQIAMCNITDADQKRFTARELFEADGRCPQRTMLVNARAEKHADEKILRGLHEAIASTRERLSWKEKAKEKLGWKHPQIAEWERKVEVYTKALERAGTTIKTVEADWTGWLGDVYAKKAGAENARRDAVISEKTEQAGQWADLMQIAMPLVRANHQLRQQERERRGPVQDNTRDNDHSHGR